MRTKFLFGSCFSLVFSNVFIYYFIIIIFTGLEKKFPVTHHQPPPDRPNSNHHRRNPPQPTLQTTASHPDTLTKTQPATTETPMLLKYQPKRGGDLGWGKLFQFKCGIKNYFQLAKID